MSSTGPEIWVYAVAIIAWSAFFGILFVAGWVLSRLYSPTFRAMSWAHRGDWCSRIGSTAHSIIVVPGFIICMSLTHWDAEYWPVDEGQPAVTGTRILMCCSMGYFLIDFIAMFVYRIPLWVVFVIHHIVACVPFYIHLFDTSCRAGTFVMQGFLLVEFANIFVNTLGWLTDVGMAKTLAYTILFYVNYFGWLAWRLAIPIFMVWVMYTFIYFSPRIPPYGNLCLIPAMCCGHIILVFCFAVFVGVLTPDVIRRWSPPAYHQEDEEEVTKKELNKLLDDDACGGAVSGAVAVVVGVQDVALEQREVSSGDNNSMLSNSSRPRSNSVKPDTPTNLSQVGSLVAETLKEILEGPGESEGERRSAFDGLTLTRSDTQGHDGATLMK